jgi:hypothetical protein
MTDFMKWRFSMSTRFHLPSAQWYDRIHLKNNNKRRNNAVILKSLAALNKKGSMW